MQNDASPLPPGPPPRKGAIANLRYYWAFMNDPLGFVGSRFRTYGDVYYAPNASAGLYVFRRPEHIHEVLVTRSACFGKKHSAFTQMSQVLGDGLLISEGDKWTRHRRMMKPGFAPAQLAAYASAMVDEARRTANGFRDRQRIAVDREMSALTLRVVSRTLFGHDVSDEDSETIARAMAVFQRSLGPDIFPSWLPLPWHRPLARSIEDLDRIVYRVLAARREEAKRPKDAPRADLLQILIDAVDPEGDAGSDQNKLSEREVRDQLVTLFLAGHDTTSQALNWTFYCLARTPAAERKLHEELDAVLGDRDPTFADVERLVYTEQVILEALRLYPPAFAIARNAETETEVGGWRIPRGSEVMLWTYWTHRDPAIYPEPEVFRPERFEPTAVAERPKLAYLPFGAGPRACIGRAFALLEAKLILATLARRHRFALVPADQRIAPRPMVTLTPAKGMQMEVHTRH